MSSSTYKLAFIGEPGSGKTSCIAALSDVAPVDTEVGCTDVLVTRKSTTTVALDFGVLDMGEQGRLLLYGLPGQPRFRFMFDVVRAGLLGVVVLVDASSAHGLDGFDETLRTHRSGLGGLPFVVALNKSDAMAPDLPEHCRMRLRAHGLLAPILRVDARRREDVLRIAELIFTLLRYDQRVPEPAVELDGWP